MRKKVWLYGSIAALLLVFVPYFTVKPILKERAASSRVFNLGYPINTDGDDFAPSVTSDGKVMVFSSKLPEEEDHNIYISYFTNGQWSKPEYFTVLNSKFNDETPYITPDATTIVFASDRDGSMLPPKDQYGDDRITYDLYISQKKDGKWSEPVRIPGDVNTIENERSPSLSLDKKTIYFTRWPYKDIDQSKLYQAGLIEGAFVNAKELPPVINAGGYEMGFRPSTTRHGFYFSSQRDGGYGGWDIYFISFEKGVFGRPVNMGLDINSEDNDLFLTEGGNKFFFCSNRAGGSGKYDIYSAYSGIEYKKIKDDATSGLLELKLERKGDISVKMIQGSEGRLNLKTVKKDTGSVLSVPVKISIFDTDDLSGKPVKVLIEKVNADGNISIPVAKEFRSATVEINEKGYIPLKRSFRTEQGKSTEVVLELEQTNDEKKEVSKTVKTDPEIKKNDKQEGPRLELQEDIVKTDPDNANIDDNIFKPLYFGFNSARIKMEDYPQLHKIIDFMRKNRGTTLVIYGHSDYLGTEQANIAISYYRAYAVRAYLVKMGISIKRIKIMGLGNKYTKKKIKPQTSRRVEFKLRGKKTAVQENS